MLRMRVVADTNVVISGLFWRGPSRSILDAAHSGLVQLFTSAPLLVELEEVLNRPKFVAKLKQANVTPRDLVLGYATLATVINPVKIKPVIIADPDDDAVLECALSASVDVIVSGDSHLLDLREYLSLRILSARQAIELLAKEE